MQPRWRTRKLVCAAGSLARRAGPWHRAGVARQIQPRAREICLRGSGRGVGGEERGAKQPLSRRTHVRRATWPSDLMSVLSDAMLHTARPIIAHRLITHHWTRGGGRVQAFMPSAKNAVGEIVRLHFKAP